MTGKEAWDLIAPELQHCFEKGEEYIEAYLTVFFSLRKYDKEKQDEQSVK